MKLRLRDVTPGTPLLPCPFCESTRVEWRGVYVFCWDCQAQGPRRVIAGESQVAWNRRVATPSPETGTLPRFDGEDYLRAMPGGHTMAAGPAPEPATPLVQVGVGNGCWDTVKEPLRHPDNSVSFAGTAGRRYRTKPGNWRSTPGDVPLATGVEAIHGIFDPDGTPVTTGERKPPEHDDEPCERCNGDGDWLPAGACGACEHCPNPVKCTACNGTGRTPAAGTAPMLGGVGAYPVSCWVHVDTGIPTDGHLRRWNGV